MTWTVQRIELLKKLWADGLSCSQIAHQLGGVTRNAVIGKVHRLNLPTRLKANSQPRTRTPQRPRLIRNAHAIMVSVTEVIEPPSVVDMFIPLFQRKTLMELENSHCRFPVGEPGTEAFFFCGDPSANVAGGHPYCAGHAARTFSKSGTERSRNKRAEWLAEWNRRRAA